VAAGPSLAVFLLAAQVAQQCLVTPEKSVLTFSTESYVFGQAPPFVMTGIIGAIQAVGLASWRYPEPLEGPVIPVSNLYQTSCFGALNSIPP
jgi:hypothetical protein